MPRTMILPEWVNISTADDTVSVQAVGFTAAYNNIYICTDTLSVQLPAPVANKRIKIKNLGANVITLVRAGTEEIEGVAANFQITSEDAAVTLVTDGTNWFIV